MNLANINLSKNNLIKASEHFRENGFNIFRVKYIDKEEDYVQYTAYQLLFDLSKSTLILLLLKIHYHWTP